MEFIAPIITAIGTIIVAWFAYNQKTKDRMTELKVEMFKKEEEAKFKRRADNSSIIYGELWNVLHELEADRVYIVQPHPLDNESMLSVFFEVKRMGFSGMKERIQGLPIAEVAKFSSDLVRNLFMYFTDIDKQVTDKRAMSIFAYGGCKSAIVKRLSDSRHDWNGSIFCEFTHPMSVSEETAQKVMHTAATNIQYILPEFK